MGAAGREKKRGGGGGAEEEEKLPAPSPLQGMFVTAVGVFVWGPFVFPLNQSNPF